MSYTNPKYIQLADPNAAVEAYEKGASKWLSFFEKKKKEEQEIKNKAIASNVRLHSSQKHGETAEKYGSSIATAYRDYIDNTLVKDNVFASMNEADQQRTIDDLNINVRSKLPIANNLMALDPENIDTNILRENPAFNDFINNKTNGSAVFHVDKNGPGIKYKDEAGNEKIFYTKDVNYDETLFDINGSIDTLNTKVEDVAKDLDRSYRGIDKKQGIQSGVQKAAIEYFNKLSKSEKIVYYNKMAEEGFVDSSAYGVFPEGATPDEIREIQKVQDLKLIDYVTSEIKERSSVYNQFEYESKEQKVEKPTAEKIKDLQDQKLAGERSQYFKDLEYQTKRQSPDYAGPGVLPGQPIEVVDLTHPSLTNKLSKKGVKMGNPYKTGGVVYVELTDQVTNNTITVSEKDMTPDNFGETISNLVSGFKNTGGLP